MSETLRRIIREVIIEELELDETTSSGAAGPYNTPFAFRGNSAEGKAKAKKNSTVATGYDLVDKTQEKADEAGPQNNDTVEFGEKGKTPSELKAPKKEEVVQESTISISDKIKEQEKKLADAKKLHAARVKVGTDKLAPHGTIKKIEDRIAQMKKSKQYKAESIVAESKYSDFKTAEGTPRRKIGEAIREINKQIHEVDRTLRMSERLKKEDGSGPNGQLWKSTAKALTTLEGRLNTISTRIRNLKA